MKHDADWKIIATLGFLVATVAVPTVASLVAPEDTPAMATPNMEVRQNKDDSSREPASTKKDDAHVISFDVSCAKGKSFTFNAQGSYIQLKGRDCTKTTSKKPMTITNKSNGFQASIFEVSKNEYQTDLIQLQNGENQISVKFESAAGKSEEQVLQVKADNI